MRWQVMANDQYGCSETARDGLRWGAGAWTVRDPSTNNGILEGLIHGQQYTAVGLAIAVKPVLEPTLFMLDLHEYQHAHASVTLQPRPRAHDHQRRPRCQPMLVTRYRTCTRRGSGGCGCRVHKGRGTIKTAMTASERTSPDDDRGRRDDDIGYRRRDLYNMVRKDTYSQAQESRRGRGGDWVKNEANPFASSTTDSC
ncbi:hypothetical protein D9619_011015 [Psilocybe cf. subviscida]|uniref:Uncharacterized protein n=1 Tax=Psilocybe cf. subviscida TaxID=2480587 RepID=A0A8H5EZV1_9AGAR|nr:hypothetical protein D9619_011015 [Psilocybe cf. subviscida]